MRIVTVFEMRWRDGRGGDRLMATVNVSKATVLASLHASVVDTVRPNRITLLYISLRLTFINMHTQSICYGNATMQKRKGKK